MTVPATAVGRLPAVGEELEVTTATGLTLRYRVLSVEVYDDGLRLSLASPEEALP